MDKELLTFIGLVFTFIGLIYTAEQIRRSRKVSLANFLLQLDDQFRNYNEIHIKLHHRGDWANNKGSPETKEEWILVEQYMGLFERIHIMVEAGIIPLEVINKLYGYRVANIVKNDEIKKEQLVKYKKYWKKCLTKKLKAI